jgi:hypothetical protein
MMSIARCLIEPEVCIIVIFYPLKIILIFFNIFQFDMGQYLGVFIRDELITWHYMCQRMISEQQLRERVKLNVEQIVHKAKIIACLESDREKLLDKVCKNLITVFSKFNITFFVHIKNFSIYKYIRGPLAIRS